MGKFKVEITGIDTNSIKTLPNAETIKLIEKYKETNEKRYKDKLVNGNLKLVLLVVNKFQKRTDNLDDIFSKNKDGKFFFFTTKARQTHSDVTYTDKSFLFFGKETKGLPEELLLEHPNECVRIPMIDDARSLNLSNSVAIGVYEALRQMGYPELSNKGELHNYKWE